MNTQAAPPPLGSTSERGGIRASNVRISLGSLLELDNRCSFKFLVQTFILLIAVSALLTITLYNYLLIQTLRETDTYKDVKLFSFGSSFGTSSGSSTAANLAAPPAAVDVAAKQTEGTSNS